MSGWRSRRVCELNSLSVHSSQLIQYHAFSFLDSLERVTAARYMPTDGGSDYHNGLSRNPDLFSLLDDILRARLKTLGVSEHRFKISTSMSRWLHSYKNTYLSSRRCYTRMEDI